MAMMTDLRDMEVRHLGITEDPLAMMVDLLDMMMALQDTTAVTLQDTATAMEDPQDMTTATEGLQGMTTATEGLQGMMIAMEEVMMTSKFFNFLKAPTRNGFDSVHSAAADDLTVADEESYNAAVEAVDVDESYADMDAAIF
jgi:hypothetical protein